MEGMGFDMSSQNIEMTEVLATTNSRIIHEENV